MAPEPVKVNRRRFLRRSGAALGTASVGAGVYAWRVEPHWIEVVRRPMPLENLPAGWVGKRLVQISDLHVGPVVSRPYLESALQRVFDLRPDLLVVTGDWMTCADTEQVDATIDLARQFPRDTPTIGILGNHDYGLRFRNIVSAETLAKALRQAGVLVLQNERTEVDGLQFAGVDDPWAGRCRVAATIRQLHADQPTIMLSHNPDTVDYPGWGDFRGWVLSGHTHGGQCRAPGFRAPVLPIENARYAAGEIELAAGRRLYVNRAVGYKHRVRFMVRPEITVFELTAA